MIDLGFRLQPVLDVEAVDVAAFDVPAECRRITSYNVCYTKLLRVKVYTVGFGTAEGAATNIDGMSIYMRFDAETLEAIAALTGAEYFHA